MKTITTLANKLALKAKFQVVAFNVERQIIDAINGKEADVPASTPNGVTILDASMQMSNAPDARAFGSVVPDQLKGLESHIVMNRRLASCSTFLPAVLLHEEAHVLFDMVPECGHTMEESELFCDNYMMQQGLPVEQLMAMAAMLMFFNPSMLASGQEEAYRVNEKRIAAILEHIGL